MPAYYDFQTHSFPHEQIESVVLICYGLPMSTNKCPAAVNKWRKDELNVTHGLIARSFVPILLWTTKMSYHLIASSGVSIHITVLYIIDAIPPAAVGLTTLFSCLSVKMIRRVFVDLLLCRNSEDTPVNSLATNSSVGSSRARTTNTALPSWIAQIALSVTPFQWMHKLPSSSCHHSSPVHSKKNGCFRNAIISWAGTIPTVFLVLVIMINPRLWTRYKDRLSTLFACSFSRIVINYVSLIPQAVEPIIVLTRYRRIVLDRETPIWASALVAGFFGGTMISLALILVYGFSTITLSILTAIFLRKHARTIAKAKKNARDEMCVSVGIVARSAVPVFFWFIRALSVLLSGDWSLPRWFYTLFDTISYGSVACSTIASCAPIPVFRQMFFRALLLGRYRSPTVYPTAAAISQIEEERVQNQEGKARETKATATSAVSTF
ncbi:hypothetical protein PRIPAC_70303 [Pristionchus pacificus]|uniref:Uncharacterized protein n=1 Tax=Pristionchus pacificus TaxID=54126 RepID=A0A2A6C583_PRIPA|nr:hypothetical protein PRIPAC_70303 [Pristionchus pacificus]|eukprot:PDM73299.1 hypothetical protein PRIPAC_40655 [Pristionchus pacificus]